MLPGMDGTGDLFAPIIARLGTKIVPIVVRYPDEPLGYAALIAYARKALPTSGDFFLLGESFSGPVAVALAAERHPRLRGLILSASFIRNPLPFTAPLVPLVELLPVTGEPAALMTRALLGQFSTPALQSMIAASLGQMSAATIRARLRAIASVDMQRELKTVVVPILYLQASHDRVVLQSAGRLITSLRPGTTVVPVTAPHFLLQTAVDEAAQAIAAFINADAERYVRY